LRIQLLSDIHVEFHADAGRDFVESLDPASTDVLVLAGDIAVGAGIVGALGLFCERYARSTVVYVHGNHEFYGTDRDSVVGFTKQAQGQHENLVWLDADVAEIQGRRFLGGPLWFRHDPANQRYHRAMADFSEIRGLENWLYEENARMISLLEDELAPGDIVVTHHLPSYRSVAPRFSGSPLNAFFVCDVEALIQERHPLLWMHGHTHSSVDVTLGDTRILCNPFGYVGWELNQEFRDAMIVEV
jgi:Icc-related predicted phosphoesterase